MANYLVTLTEEVQGKSKVSAKARVVYISKDKALTHLLVNLSRVVN